MISSPFAIAIRILSIRLYASSVYSLSLSIARSIASILLCGVAGIALSTDFGDPTPALSQLDAVKTYFDERALLRHCTHWNVNIPAAAKGFRFTQQGGIFYTDEFVPQGNDMFSTLHPLYSFSLEVRIAAPTLKLEYGA